MFLGLYTYVIAEIGGMHGMAGENYIMRGIIDKKFEGMEIDGNSRELERYGDFVGDLVEGFVGNFDCVITMCVRQADGGVVHEVVECCTRHNVNAGLAICSS